VAAPIKMHNATYQLTADLNAQIESCIVCFGVPQLVGMLNGILAIKNNCDLGDEDTPHCGIVIGLWHLAMKSNCDRGGNALIN
jgi:hypothetical protein